MFVCAGLVVYILADYFSRAIKYSSVSDSLISDANNASWYLMVGDGWPARRAAACEIRGSSVMESECGADDVKQKRINELFEATALNPVVLSLLLTDKT